MFMLATSAVLAVLAYSAVEEPRSCVAAYGALEKLAERNFGVALPANAAAVDFAARKAAAMEEMRARGAPDDEVEKAGRRGLTIYTAADLSVVFGNPPPDFAGELAWARLCDQQFGFSPVLDPKP